MCIYEFRISSVDFVLQIVRIVLVRCKAAYSTEEYDRIRQFSPDLDDPRLSPTADTSDMRVSHNDMT